MRGPVELEYRGTPNAEPFDPGSQRLGRVATFVAGLCWISALVATFSPESAVWPFILASLFLGIVGSAYAIGAVLNPRVPTLAWVAVAGLSAYWLWMLGVIMLRFIRASGELRRLLHLFF